MLGGGEVVRFHTNRRVKQKELRGRRRTGADLVGNGEIEVLPCVGWRCVDCQAQYQEPALLGVNAL